MIMRMFTFVHHEFLNVTFIFCGKASRARNVDVRILNS